MDGLAAPRALKQGVSTSLGNANTQEGEQQDSD